MSKMGFRYHLPFIVSKFYPTAVKYFMSKQREKKMEISVSFEKNKVKKIIRYSFSIHFESQNVIGLSKLMAYCFTQKYSVKLLIGLVGSIDVNKSERYSIKTNQVCLIEKMKRVFSRQEMVQGLPIRSSIKNKNITQIFVVTQS